MRNRFLKAVISWAIVQLQMLNHDHTRPSGCVSQQGLVSGILYLRQWKAHILGKHLTPAPFLLLSCSLSLQLPSLYGHVLFSQLLSPGCLIGSSAGHKFSFNRYLFGQWEKSHIFEQPLLPPVQFPLSQTLKLLFIANVLSFFLCWAIPHSPVTPSEMGSSY